MGAAGAVVAARQRRIQAIVDAFRLADATAADRARTLETIGLVPSGDLRELLVEGVLLPGAREGTYYLSEVGYISRRDDRRGLKAVLIVVMILLVIAAAVIPRLVSRG
jgi:hypothetical protein